MVRAAGSTALSWSTADRLPSGGLHHRTVGGGSLKFTATEPLRTVSAVTSMVYMALEAVEPPVNTSSQLSLFTPMAS